MSLLFPVLGAYLVYNMHGFPLRPMTYPAGELANFEWRLPTNVEHDWGSYTPGPLLCKPGRIEVQNARGPASLSLRPIGKAPPKGFGGKRGKPKGDAWVSLRKFGEPARMVMILSAGATSKLAGAHESPL